MCVLAHAKDVHAMKFASFFL